MLIGTNKNMFSHIPSQCQLPTQGMVAEFNFLSVNNEGKVEVSINLSSLPDYNDLVLKSRSAYYSFGDLRRLIIYLEAHISRINEGILGRAPHGFCLLQSKFKIDALSAYIFEDEVSFELQFFIDIGRRNQHPLLFVGFQTGVDSEDVIEFVSRYRTILDNIEHDLYYPKGGFFPDL